VNPVKTADTNFCYTGPIPEIADLPCRVEGHNTSSTWELTSDELEQLYLHGGRLRLTIIGHPIPPVMLEVVSSDGPARRVKAPCDVCGLEVDEPVHMSGDGTHAYRHRKPG
jgi:hypothetical protein